MTKTDILQYLRKSGGFVSGEEISRHFGVSRAAVWKVITALREDGYVIDSVTKKGYHLAEAPDLLSEAEIREGLHTARIGTHIFSFDTVDSTNEEAKRQGQAGAPDGSVFVAEQQTGGKGRLGRVWSSPRGKGIWFTILLRPGGSPLQVSNITLLAGLAVCSAIRKTTGCPAMIKWPNDVIIGSKKVCGILTEISAEMDCIHYLVIGIGINANNESFPEELSVKATSLQIETGTSISRVKLLQAVLEEFEALYRRFPTAKEPEFLDLYRAVCASLNRRVSTVRQGKTITGKAINITPDGELLIELDTGENLAVNAGEVTVQGIYGQ